MGDLWGHEWGCRAWCVELMGLLEELNMLCCMGLGEVDV